MHLGSSLPLWLFFSSSLYENSRRSSLFFLMCFKKYHPAEAPHTRILLHSGNQKDVPGGGERGCAAKQDPNHDVFVVSFFPFAFFASDFSLVAIHCVNVNEDNPGAACVGANGNRLQDCALQHCTPLQEKVWQMADVLLVAVIDVLLWPALQLG